MARKVLTRKQQQERTRAELLAAAGRVFARRGYHGASVEDIAAEAGYTSGALYSNFDGKEGIFLALTDYELEKRLVDFRAVDTADSSHGEVQHAASERFEKFIREDPDWPLLYFEFWAYAARNPRLRPEFAKRRQALQDVIAQNIERQASELGVELPLPAAQIAVAVGALINGLAFERVVDPDSVPDDLFGVIVERLLAGLMT